MSVFPLGVCTAVLGEDKELRSRIADWQFIAVGGRLVFPFHSHFLPLRFLV